MIPTPPTITVPAANEPVWVCWRHGNRPIMYHAPEHGLCPACRDVVELQRRVDALERAQARPAA